MKIVIPNFKEIEIKNIVLDYNGTIAKDGRIKKEVKNILQQLKEFNIYIITADTHGNVKNNIKDLNVNLKILTSSNHIKEKGEFVKSLKNVFAIGNGNNDSLMLKEALIGVCVIEDEGCSKDAFLNADIVCKSIEDALNLIKYPKRMIATLRR